MPKGIKNLSLLSSVSPTKRSGLKTNGLDQNSGLKFDRSWMRRISVPASISISPSFVFYIK